MIEKYLFYIALSWFFVYFEPLQAAILKGFGQLLKVTKYATELYKVIACWVCVCFWLTLFTSNFDFKLALFTSFTVWVIEKALTKSK